MASTKKAGSSSDESALRKKLVELHNDDVSVFDDESLLASIEGIINHVHVMPRVDATPELNCKCSGEDGYATSLEILQLLANYTWEAKIVIILASFVVEYGQYCLVAKLSKSDQLTKLVAMLKQIPEPSEEIFEERKSRFETIIKLVRVSIEVTRFIAKFRGFQSKYITNDAQPMIEAWNQIPIAVYWMTRVVVACASEYSLIVGNTTEITSSYSETWSITNLEQKITGIQTSFKTQFDKCSIHIEEKKRMRYVEKLKLMFRQTTIQMGNQSVLHTILKKKKDAYRLISCGPETKIEVEDLKGKTVLLLISDLEISDEEITKIGYFYEESRKKTQYQYEIVWVPIVEKVEVTEEFDLKVKELKRKMPWHAIEHPCYVKPGLVKFVREEWRYSKKSIMVSIDQRGRVVHENSFNMIWTWGNAAYPFTKKREQDQWNILKEWSLKLLVEETNQQMSTWIQEKKYICLFGGDDYVWIQDFVKEARRVASASEIELEMVYIYKKNTREEHMTEINKTLSNSSVVVWEKTTSIHFWKKIECMLYSKVNHGPKITKLNEPGSDPILPEVINMLTLGDHEKGWGLISRGAGEGPKMIAKAKGDVILKAFGEFSSWSSAVKEEGLATALHNYLLSLPIGAHHCNRLTLPGIEDIPGTMICGECHRPMEKYIMYRCCVE